MKNILLIYEELPERTRIFFFGMDAHDENFARLKTCHGKMSNGVGEYAVDDPEWLTRFVDALPVQSCIYDTNTHDTQPPVLNYECVIIITGFIL